MSQSISRLWRAGLLVLAVLLLPLAGRADAANGFMLLRVVLPSRPDASAICLRFSQNLQAGPAVHYGDYLKLEPAAKIAVTVAGTDLCLGGLDEATSYQLTLRQGLPAADGQKLAANQTLDLALADRAPLVAISGDGYILSRNTADGLVIQTVNVTKLKIHVLRMSDKLLSTEIGPGAPQYGGLQLHAQTISPYDLRNWLQNTVSTVWTGTMDVPQDHNRTVSTAFPIARVIPQDRNGLYLVVAENAAKARPENFFTGKEDDTAYDPSLFERSLAAHWALATDIALSSVSGADGLHVFARSLATARPLEGVSVSLVSAGQDVLARQSTDTVGETVFSPTLMAGTGANAPATLLAYGDQKNFAFQDLSAPGFDLSDRGVSGRQAPGALQAFLYTERGIFRPGEMVHAMALLRDRLGDAVQNLPLKLVLRRPDGVTDRTFVLPPAPEGGFLQPIALSATAPRGDWTLEAYADPTAAPIGRVQFAVQDFVPQQLKVSLATAQKFLRPDQEFAAALQGEFLYGAPAAGLNAQADLRIARDLDPVPGAQAYQFGLVDDQVTDLDDQLDLPPADADGHIAIAAALPDLPATSVPLKAVLTAGLFEPSGRYVSDQVSLPIRAQPLLIGIKPLFADGQVQEGTPPRFDIATFDDAGKPVGAKSLSWALVKEEPIYDWFQENGSGWTWHFRTRDRQVASGALDAPAAGVENFAPSGLPQFPWGTYRLIVSDNATGAMTSTRFNIGWSSSPMAASTPDRVQVRADKALLRPGETTELHIEAPFAAKAELLIANDRVFSTQVFDIPEGGTSIAVTGSKDWGAGAYAVVTLYRPMSEGGPRTPVRAIGLVWLGIDSTPHRLDVAIAAPEKILPRQTIKLPVTIGGAVPGEPAYVTLAAVDEGILQLTSYATPDPFGYFYGKTGLGVDLRDDYGNLLDGNANVGAIHEGAGEGELGGPGLPVESTKVVSLFSGPVQVGEDGKTTIPLKVPDFEGQLRLMAVAYDATQLGDAASTMIVRDKVIADLALPRFLAPGDRAQLAVSLHDTDGKAGVYRLALSASGPVSFSGAQEIEQALTPGARVQKSVTIAASDVGIGKIEAVLTGPDHYRVVRDWQIAVRSAHYPVTLQQVAIQAPDQEFRIDPRLLGSFLRGSLSVSVGYAGYQGIDVPSLMQSLWLYPYGCTEQLVSTSFPLLYYRETALLGDIGRSDPQHRDTSAAGVHARVQQAIDTILDRQDFSGEFGLWDVGDGAASAWLNVYAMDFLVHAKTAGFSVPDAALARGYANLQTIVARIDSGTAGDSETEQGLEAPKATLAYAEYLLAQAGQADLGLLRRMHDAAVVSKDPREPSLRYAFWAPNPRSEQTLAEPLALAQLSGALQLMGDGARAQSAMRMAVQNIGIANVPGWWFDETYYSEARDLAGVIAVAAAEGNEPLVASLLQRLAGLRIAPDRLNTQDKAWLLAASAALNARNPVANLRVNGKPAAAYKLPASFAPDPAAITAGFSIRDAGGAKIWRTLTITGAPALTLPAISAGYTLEKTFWTLDGKPLDPAHLRQNDRFIVSLRGHATDALDHRSVLVDMLPAGWEIEAPIIDDGSLYGFLGPLSTTRTEEARDDRFVAAFDLGSGWAGFQEQNDDQPHLGAEDFHAAYLVRVVTPGRFTLPEAEINDMYRPGDMARSAAGSTIADPR